MRRNEVYRIVIQTQKCFEEESNESDENSDESLEQPEIFCEQSRETVISSNSISCDETDRAGESHDSDINTDGYITDNEEQLHQLSSSDNNITNSSENEQSESANDNEDDIFQFPNIEVKEVYVTETIREWALKGGVLSMSKLDDLLLRLNVVHPNLPKSYKSLLKTPSHLNIVRTERAQIWYKSIRMNLDTMLLEKYLETYHQISIDVNIDGLPISKSSPLKFWPILGRLIGSKNEPFVISIYFGTTDPTSVCRKLFK